MTGRNRRHATLLKKARELSTLCDAEVALITFEKDGKFHDFSCLSGKKVDIEQTLLRYANHPKGGRALLTDQPDPSLARGRAIVPVDDDNRHRQRIHALKEQHARLELEMSHRMGKNLEGLSKEALNALEQEQKDALINVLKKKEELLVGHLMKVKERERERRAIIEKEDLTRRDVPRLLQPFPEKSVAWENNYVHPNRPEDMNIDLSLKL